MAITADTNTTKKEAKSNKNTEYDLAGGSAVVVVDSEATAAAGEGAGIGAGARVGDSEAVPLLLGPLPSDDPSVTLEEEGGGGEESELRLDDEVDCGNSCLVILLAISLEDFLYVFFAAASLPASTLAWTLSGSSRSTCTTNNVRSRENGVILNHAIDRAYSVDAGCSFFMLMQSESSLGSPQQTLYVARIQLQNSNTNLQSTSIKELYKI